MVQPTIPSRYNFCVPAGTSVLVYNTNTGALIRLEGDDGSLIGCWLSSGRRNLEWELPGAVADLLRTGGFVVPAGTDELASVRERYWRARDETPMVLTVTTTQDCNLGCFYCYEERSGDKLGESDVAGLVAFAKRSLEGRASRSLHVDWYGGEPLLNVAFLESASLALQQMCREAGVAYHGSVISNGTNWPSDPAGFARRHAIRQVQISFDGQRAQHDRSRRYRAGYGEPGSSSFDEAVQTVDALLEATRVDIRINIGRHNMAGIEGLIEMARSRGWFRKPFPAVIQPARLSAFTDTCGFLRPREFSQEEFEGVRQRVREAVNGEALIEETEAPDGLPLPKSSVCAALASGSAVIGADGLEYRCGLQVGNQQRATGETRMSPFPILTGRRFADAAWWQGFDPTTLPKCSACSFLPICLGGCPHKHLESDQHALDEQGEYWRANLPRLIAERAGVELPEPVRFTERDQHKFGWSA